MRAWSGMDQYAISGNPEILNNIFSVTDEQKRTIETVVKTLSAEVFGGESFTSNHRAYKENIEDLETALNVLNSQLAEERATTNDPALIFDLENEIAAGKASLETPSFTIVRTAATVGVPDEKVLVAGVFVSNTTPLQLLKDEIEAQYTDGRSISLDLPSPRKKTGFVILFDATDQAGNLHTFGVFVGDTNPGWDIIPDSLQFEELSNAFPVLFRMLRSNGMTTVEFSTPTNPVEPKDDIVTVLEPYLNAILRSSSLKVTSTKTSSSRFTAYFNYLPETMRVEEYMKGKLVSEAVAHNILDTAAISSMDSREAVLLLQAYLEQQGGPQLDDGTAGSKELSGFITRIQKREEATATAKLFREAILARKKVPVRNILNAKDEEAGDKTKNPAFNFDAPTAEFERDIGAAQNTREEAATRISELYSTVFSCMFGTLPDTRVLAHSVKSDYGNMTEGNKAALAYGAVLYTGKDAYMLSLPAEPPQSKKEPAGQQGAGAQVQPVQSAAAPDKDTGTAAVKHIFEYGRIPILTQFIISLYDVWIQKVEAEIALLLSNFAVLARVEHAREIELPYDVASLDYGTSSTAETVGTGTNVTLLTDCAYICARVLNYMKSAGLFTKVDSSDNTTLPSKFAYVLKSPYENPEDADFGAAVVSDASLLADEIHRHLRDHYVGHCYVREGDMGRVLTASLVHQGKIDTLRGNAKLDKYKSQKADPDDPVTLFYHQIWARELGNHAVAQGGARLSESHMMIPYLVRVTSDSDHVIPTLCAFEDWIGPSEQFFRIEQTCLMELENYCYSRPSVKYAKGGRGTPIKDIGAWIRDYGTPDPPMTFEVILGEVDQAYQRQAVTCCSMLMEAVHTHTVYTDDARRGGLARQRASETSVRTMAERVAKLPRKP